MKITELRPEDSEAAALVLKNGNRAAALARLGELRFYPFYSDEDNARGFRRTKLDINLAPYWAAASKRRVQVAAELGFTCTETHAYGGFIPSILNALLLWVELALEFSDHDSTSIAREVRIVWAIVSQLGDDGTPAFFAAVDTSVRLGGPAAGGDLLRELERSLT